MKEINVSYKLHQKVNQTCMYKRKLAAILYKYIHTYTSILYTSIYIHIYPSIYIHIYTTIYTHLYI